MSFTDVSEIELSYRDNPTFWNFYKKLLDRPIVDNKIQKNDTFPTLYVYLHPTIARIVESYLQRATYRLGPSYWMNRIYNLYQEQHMYEYHHYELANMIIERTNEYIEKYILFVKDCIDRNVVKCYICDKIIELIDKYYSSGLEFKSSEHNMAIIDNCEYAYCYRKEYVSHDVDSRYILWKDIQNNVLFKLIPMILFLKKILLDIKKEDEEDDEDYYDSDDDENSDEYIISLLEMIEDLYHTVISGCFAWGEKEAYEDLESHVTEIHLLATSIKQIDCWYSLHFNYSGFSLNVNFSNYFP